ncbi:hypothetical protein ACP275_08G075800 [Erythranthe tilingii]
MNSEFEDQMVLISQYYPDGMYNNHHFVPEQTGAAAAGVVNSKPRRRRKKNKGGGDDDGCGGVEGMLRKRKLSEEQVNMLERSFGSEHKLESERKDKLAAELGLDPRQVAVWFQNRRARWKSKKLEEEYSKLKAEHESTVVKNCHLETELLKLKEQLNEANRAIQRLSEQRSDGFSSNSPSSSFSMEGLGNVFYVPENNYFHGMEWDNNIYYM